MITTAGRTDLQSLFTQGELITSKKLNHTPFIVFDERDGNVQVVIVDNCTELLKYGDATKVMAQWRGKWRSDFFQFTVGQVREAAGK